MTTLFEALFKVDSSQVDKATDSVKKMGAETDKSTKSGEDLTGMFDSLGSTLGSVSSFLDKFVAGVLKSVGAVGALVAAIGALGITMAIDWATKIDDMADLGEMYGYTANQVLFMKRAAEDAGGSMEAGVRMFDKIAKSAVEAGNTTSEAAKAYKTLGVSLVDTDGKAKSQAAIANELANAWENGKKSLAEQDAMMIVAGRSYKEGVVVTKEMADALELEAEYRAKGIGISDESVAATGRLEAAQKITNITMADMGSQLVEKVIPSFTELVKWFNASYESGGLVRTMFEGLLITVRAVVTIMELFLATILIIELSLTSLGKLLGATAASIALFLKGDFTGAKAVWADFTTDVASDLVEMETKMYRLREASTSKGRTFSEPEPNEPGADEPPKITNTITSASGAFNDPYAKYLASLERTIEVQQQLNMEKRAEAEINRINLKFAEDDLRITEHNAKVMAEGKGALQNRLDPAVREKEIAQIREAAKATDELTASEIINTNTTKDLKEITDSYARTVDREINGKTKSNEEKRKENVIDQIHLKTLKEIDALKKKGLDTPENVSEIRLKEKEAIDEVTRSTEKLNEANDNWLKGGIDDFIAKTGTLQDGLKTLTTKGIDGVAESLTNLATTGKSGMKDFVKSMLVELERYIIKLLIVKALQAAMGAMFGGGGDAVGGATLDFGGGMPVAAAADGAEINGGQTILVGEKGPERFVPKQAGTIVPNNKLGGANTSITTVNNITINSTGDNSKPEDQQKLAQVITKMIDTKFNENLAKANRPGGQLNQVSMQV